MSVTGHDVVVIAASAGGIEALTSLVRGLPAALPASLFVVQHVGATSVLPEILGRAGKLPAVHAKHMAPITRGRIVIAPPNHHLALGAGHVRVISGPKENNARPAADVLFRSAARVYGPRVVGVVLSGALHDGTAGLDAVARAGGVTVVQDLREAMVSDMPRSALEKVRVDHVLPVAKIAELIVRLSTDAPAGLAIDTTHPPLALLDPRRTGNSSAYSCPECGGVLWESDDQDVLQFRCRVGHAYVDESLAVDQSFKLESALWTALGQLEENADLSHRLARRAHERGHKHTAARFEERAIESERQAAILREALADDTAERAPPPEDRERRRET